VSPLRVSGIALQGIILRGILVKRLLWWGTQLGHFSKTWSEATRVSEGVALPRELPRLAVGAQLGRISELGVSAAENPCPCTPHSWVPLFTSAINPTPGQVSGISLPNF
jgi:hypothetical protein